MEVVDEVVKGEVVEVGEGEVEDDHEEEAVEAVEAVEGEVEDDHEEEAVEAVEDEVEDEAVDHDPSLPSSS